MFKLNNRHLIKILIYVNSERLKHGPRRDCGCWILDEQTGNFAVQKSREIDGLVPKQGNGECVQTHISSLASKLAQYLCKLGNKLT